MGPILLSIASIVHPGLCPDFKYAAGFQPAKSRQDGAVRPESGHD